MKKLLLSVVALMVATLLFSLDNSSTGVDEEISQDNIEISKDAENVS